MSRRVVVTGMGAISPIGNDVPTMWKNMVDGVCGIETITAFDHFIQILLTFSSIFFCDNREKKRII